MKKILYILLFIPFLGFGQTKVIAPIAPNTPTDTYPTHTDIYGKGGLQSVADITERNAISAERRKELMMVGVISEQKIYQLQGGITNANWVEFESGGGGPEGLTDKAVLFGKSDGTVDEDPAGFNYDKTTKSLYVNTTGNTTLVSGSIVFFGNSITAGIGASSADTRFPKIVSNLTGYSEINNGVSSSTLQKRAPIDYGGATNMVDRINTIPTKTSALKYLVFSYGINDWRYNGGSYNADNFLIDYTTVLNAAIAKGWTGSEIILTSLPFVDMTNLVGLATAGSPNQTTFDSYNSAIQTLVTNFGTKYVDIFTPVATHGGMTNMSDAVHPGDAGHYIYGLTISNALLAPVTKDGQKLAVNGTVEFSDIKYKTFNMISDTNGFLLGSDETGRIGISTAIRPNTRHLGTQYFSNNIIQSGATLPSGGLGSRDILLRKGTKLYGVFDGSPGFANYIELSEASGHMKYVNGYNLGQMQFFTGATSATPTFRIMANKQLVVGDASSGRNDAYDIWMPYNKWIGSAAAGAYGAFEPMDGGISTNLRNSYLTGSISEYTSGGTTGQQVLVKRTFASGRLIMQNGGTYTDIPVSRHTVNSTTEGVLIPRMTTTQRDAIGKVTSIGAVSPGSGYTTASISFTGGGGTGLTATANIVSGQVTSYTITNPGSGYVTPPTAIVSGDGINATALTFINLVDGLKIYNITTHKFNYYNGTEWVELGSGSSGSYLPLTGGTLSGPLTVSSTLQTSGINTLSNLSGTGTRMVVADATGILSTQTIPSGGSVTLDTEQSFTAKKNFTSGSSTSSTSIDHTGFYTYATTGESVNVSSRYYSGGLNYNRGGFTSSLDFATPTANREISIPNASGTIALTSDIPTNTNQLTNGSGFITSVPAQSWSSITSKPTSLSGYGITDAAITTGSNIDQSAFRSALGLGSNAYSSTAYFPVSGGTVTGNISATSGNFATSVTALEFNGEFTGTSTTQTANDNSSKLATTAYVDNAVGMNIGGVYTPTVSGTSLISSVSIMKAYYTRVGDIVTVQISAYLTGVTSSSSPKPSFLITLPVSYTVVSEEDVVGSGYAYNSAMGVNVKADATGKALVQMNPGIAGDDTIRFSFMYEVK